MSYDRCFQCGEPAFFRDSTNRPACRAHRGNYPADLVQISRLTGAENPTEPSPRKRLPIEERIRRARHAKRTTDR